MSSAAYRIIQFWIFVLIFFHYAFLKAIGPMPLPSCRYKATNMRCRWHKSNIVRFKKGKLGILKSRFACINQLISYGKITLWLTFKIRSYKNPAGSLILFLDKSRGLNAGYSDGSGEQTDVAVVSLPQKLWPPFVWQNRGRIVEETLHRERLEEQFSIRV